MSGTEGERNYFCEWFIEELQKYRECEAAEKSGNPTQVHPAPERPTQ